MPELKMLSRKLKRARKQMKLNQEEFAARCGISKETLSLIERENTDPRLSTIQKIASFLNDTVSDLLRIEDDK